MSRPSHLPPQYPFQGKATHKPDTTHLNPIYKSATLEDQPEWLDELLGDSNSCHEESDGMYGPNYPRGKCNTELSESDMLFLVGEMHFSDETCQNSEISDFGSNGESNTGKRHAGQCSRARKLQYIAELEETVNSFEALESEMARKSSKLVQERIVLSMETSKLKLQMARLQKHKLMLDGEYQILKKEAEIRIATFLKAWFLPPSLELVHSLGVGLASSEVYYQKMSWNKLHL